MIQVQFFRKRSTVFSMKKCSLSTIIHASGTNHCVLEVHIIEITPSTTKHQSGEFVHEALKRVLTCYFTSLFVNVVTHTTPQYICAIECRNDDIQQQTGPPNRDSGTATGAGLPG